MAAVVGDLRWLVVRRVLLGRGCLQPTLSGRGGGSQARNARVYASRFRNVFRSSENSFAARKGSGGSGGLRMLRKPVPDARKSFRMLRKPFRTLRKPFRRSENRSGCSETVRMLRNSFQMLRKPFRDAPKTVPDAPEVFRKLRKTFPTLGAFWKSRRRFRSSGSLLEAPEGFWERLTRRACPGGDVPGPRGLRTRHRCDLERLYPAETTSSHALRHPWRKPGQKEQPPDGQRLLPRPSPGRGRVGLWGEEGSASIRTEGSRLRVGGASRPRSISVPAKKRRPDSFKAVA